MRTYSRGRFVVRIGPVLSSLLRSLNASILKEAPRLRGVHDVWKLDLMDANNGRPLGKAIRRALEGHNKRFSTIFSERAFDGSGALEIAFCIPRTNLRLSSTSDAGKVFQYFSTCG
jgi:hypothetical protein